ncbi:MAG: hypothetical protein IT229_01995 [Flavobacteriales bacterium]|nr:hypothetical protein [Flavobacteriales bacterium]
MSNAAPVRLRQVRDLGQIISDSFLFVRQNWKILYKALAFACVPLVLLGSFFFMGFFRETMGNAMRGSQAVPSFTGMLLGYLFFGLAFLLFISIIQEYLRAYLAQEHTTLSSGDLIKRSLSQVPMYFGLGFVVYVIIILCMIAFIFPGIWMAISLSLVFSCHGIERAGFGSIGRSFNLVKGDWWNTFGTLFLQGLLVGVIAYAVMIPFFLLMGFGAFSGANLGSDPEAAGTTMMNAMPIMMGVMSLVYLFLYPLPIIGTALIYFSQVEKKEQRGLGDQISQFDKL